MTDDEKLIAQGQDFRGASDQYSELITDLADALEAAIAERDALGEVAFEAYRATGANEHGAQDWRGLLLSVDRHAWAALVRREVERIIEERTRAEEELDAINEGQHDADS